MSFTAKTTGIDDFYQALKRHPHIVLTESKKYLQRGIAKYKSGIINNPWRIGMSGGGAPVDTGFMRDSHITSFREFEAMIGPTAIYSPAIHKNRPWLDYVQRQKQPEIVELEKDFIDAIMNNLVR